LIFDIGAKATYNDKMSRKVLIMLAVVLIIGVVTGCVNTQNTDDETGFTFNQIRRLMQTRVSELFVGELVLLVIVILIFTLLIAVFISYRKTVRIARDAEMRERALVADNKVLDRVNRMKTEFFQNMSHDFKTPLTVISTSVLNALDLLDFDLDADEMRDSLKLAQSEIMRLSRIVDSTVRHSALHENRQSMEPVDMDPLLRNVARTYKAFLDSHGNSITLRVQRPLPPVYGNADILLNVLSNLISNSNRFTRNGELILSASLIDVDQLPENTDDLEDALNKGGSDNKVSADKRVSITVEDNGEGIKPEQLPYIFNRGTSDGGTGLGLSIIKTAIESLGGTITVESTYKMGTKVTFTLPVYAGGDDV